jgi:hypothetical protein
MTRLKGEALRRRAKQKQLEYDPCAKRKSRLAKWYEANCGSLQGGKLEPDHIHDVSLGGPDFDCSAGARDCNLFKPIPASVNKSLGGQMGKQIQDNGWNVGDVITKISIRGCG